VNELQRIVARTREELVARVAERPLADVHAAALRRVEEDPPRGFAAALRAPGLSVIAEHKRRSPSAGAIREELELEDVVAAYERGGARAVSVLTERVGFGGSLGDLTRARGATSLPLLRKDFIVSEYQVAEAAAGGADALLLIVAALGDDELGALLGHAAGYGLDVLVEVHDAGELQRASRFEPAVIGINNRDLTTLRVDLERTFELCRRVSAGTTVVAESGLRTRADIDRVASAGIDAVLVGEMLMRSADMEAALRSLLQ
jgi:indole-3-glycerol phosphate synthase